MTEVEPVALEDPVLPTRLEVIEFREDLDVGFFK